jgi:type III restriction enzyme
VLGDMASSQNILVINDEAHHAWRVPAESKVKGVTKQEIEEATKWVGGLDRINQARGILTAYDFSATPFAPSGKKSSDEALFGWIVSDFGLNDANESGLVKTPRVVVRDDAIPGAKTYKSRLYHIYNDPEVKDDLNRRAEPEEPLPDLVINGYYLLGYDWRETAKDWASVDFKTPPVMITFANRTKTAAPVKYALDRKKVHIDELSDPSRTLHIDSKVLEQAEAAKEPIAQMNGGADEEAENGERDGDDEPKRKLTKKQQAELLRQQVDTVGQAGRTDSECDLGRHALGGLGRQDGDPRHGSAGLHQPAPLRAGRGPRSSPHRLRNQPRDRLFDPEYVNIFGVPFTFLPHESKEGAIPIPPKPKTPIEPDPAKSSFEISWPNVIRIDHVYKPHLSLDWSKVKLLELNASQTAKLAELAPILEGKPDVSKIAQIDLERLAREFRTQKIIFEAARDVLRPDAE